MSPYSCTSFSAGVSCVSFRTMYMSVGHVLNDAHGSKGWCVCVTLSLSLSARMCTCVYVCVGVGACGGVSGGVGVCMYMCVYVRTHTRMCVRFMRVVCSFSSIPGQPQQIRHE